MCLLKETCCSEEIITMGLSGHRSFICGVDAKSCRCPFSVPCAENAHIHESTSFLHIFHLLGPSRFARRRKKSSCSTKIQAFTVDLCCSPDVSPSRLSESSTRLLQVVHAWSRISPLLYLHCTDAMQDSTVQMWVKIAGEENKACFFGRGQTRILSTFLRL